MKGKLYDRVAIVTGAGSGIGKALAELFAREGACVVVVDILQEGIDSTVQEIKAAENKAVGYKLDVSSQEGINPLVDSVIDKYGKIDILCNNAGIMDSMMPVDEVTDDVLDRVMRVNLYAPFYLCRKVIPQMVKRDTGTILNIASMAGLFGCRAGAAYTASKHGLVGLTKNIAFMYADQGIRCNAICPGGVETNVATGATFSNSGMAKASLGFRTMPRTGSPDEIAQVGLLLVSDESKFVNGAILPVDAGWSAY